MIWSNSEKVIFRDLIQEYGIASVHNTEVHWQRYQEQHDGDAREQCARWRARFDH